MKLSVRLLREFINEGPVSVEQAGEQNLALYTGDYGDYPKVYMLYDPAKFIEEVKENMRGRKQEMLSWMKSKTIAEKCDSIVYAVIMVKDTRYPAWGASEVECAAAHKGYGPLLYDIVMGLEKGLMADRGSVSDSAKNVWHTYKIARDDVVARPLDDINKPKTVPTADDAPLHIGGRAHPLNYAYFISHLPNVGTLKANHIEGMKQMKEAGIQGVDLEDIAQAFFNKKYHT